MVSENSDDGKDHPKKFVKNFKHIGRRSLKDDSRDLGELWNPLNWDFREFFCGWGSAFINICVTYPINKVTFRQRLTTWNKNVVVLFLLCDDGYKMALAYHTWEFLTSDNMLHNLSPLTAIKEISNEGVHLLYRGILPPLCQKTTSLALMFGVYEGTRVPLSQILPSVPAKILAALISGSTEATLAPFERIQTLLQDKRYQKQFQNTKHAFQVLRRDYGYREFYRGLVPILFRNGPSNVLYFLLRDLAKQRFQEKSRTWYGKMLVDFVCGGLIGGLISTLFYPLNVVKVHMQSKLGGEFQTMYAAVVQIYSERGRKFRGFYRGVHLNYTRGFISWGVITVSSETIRRLIY